MTTSTNERQIAVIGGGMAGLTAAAYLARSGAKVTLFERSRNLGGRAATQEHEGFRFNRGIHALYTGGPASEVFKDLGVTYSAGVPKATFALRNGELHVLPATPGSFLQTSLFKMGEKLALMRFLAGVGSVKPSSVANQTVEQWINGAIRRPRVREFITAFARTLVYSSALDMVSADLLVEKLQLSLKHPIHYIDGGWQRLVDGVRDAATAAGAEIVSGTRVATIEADTRRASAVVLEDGRRMAVDAVVMALEPADTLKLLPDNAADSLRQAIHDLVPAQIACLNVALSKLPAPEHPIVLDLDSPRFMTTQSLYSQVAPAGGALIYLFKQLDPRHASDQGADEKDLEAFLDRVQPGWRDLVVRREFLPHISGSGALPLASNGGFGGRPAINATGLDNLFIAGDWVGPEGFLVDCSMASARAAAHLATKLVAESRSLVSAA